MKRLLLIFTISLSLACAGALALPAITHADAKGQMTTALNNVNDGNSTDLGAGIQTGINILLFLIGAVAVIVIIIGGIKYVTSNGESSAVQSAKNTIMYAVVGLLVAILAFAIVNFVVTQFK